MELSDVKKFSDMFGRFDTDQWRQRLINIGGRLRGQRPRARRERRARSVGVPRGGAWGSARAS